MTKSIAKDRDRIDSQYAAIKRRELTAAVKMLTDNGYVVYAPR